MTEKWIEPSLSANEKKLYVVKDYLAETYAKMIIVFNYSTSKIEIQLNRTEENKIIALPGACLQKYSCFKDFYVIEKSGKSISSGELLIYIWGG